MEDKWEATCIHYVCVPECAHAYCRYIHVHFHARSPDTLLEGSEKGSFLLSELNEAGKLRQPPTDNLVCIRSFCLRSLGEKERQIGRDRKIDLEINDTQKHSLE